MKTRIKTSMWMLGLLVWLTSGIQAEQAISGTWTDPTGHLRLEIRQASYGLDVRESTHNTWMNYNRVSADYYRSRTGEARLRFVGDQLQYTPGYGQKTWILYSRYNQRDNGIEPGYGGRDKDWDDRDWDRYDFKAMEGSWYNQSTGIRLEIKESRRDLKVRFNRDGWSDLRRYRNGLFIDEDGNTIRLQSRGIIEYQSAAGDLTMIFTDRPDNKINNRIFRGHTDFDRF